MATPEKLSLSDFINRRLHPTKVTIKLLKHELAGSTAGQEVKVDSALLGSVINTLELFVEDYEKLIEKTAAGTGSKPASTGVEREFVGGGEGKT